MDVDEEDGTDTATTGVPDSYLGLKPEAIPVPDSHSSSLQLPSSEGSVDHPPDLGSSCDKIREPSQVPKVNRNQQDEMTWDRLRGECSQRGLTKTERCGPR